MDFSFLHSLTGYLVKEQAADDNMIVKIMCLLIYSTCKRNLHYLFVSALEKMFKYSCDMNIDYLA